jgi:plastocyanin
MSRTAASIAAAAAVLVAASTAAARPATPPTLHGTVGPGFTISLTQNGKRVTHVKPGSYRLVVADRSNLHNFVLEKSHGGSFERQITTVPFTGTKAIMVKLTAGEWEFYCRPHESTMHGDLTVG